MPFYLCCRCHLCLPLLYHLATAFYHLATAHWDPFPVAEDGPVQPAPLLAQEILIPWGGRPAVKPPPPHSNNYSIPGISTFDPMAAGVRSGPIRVHCTKRI